MKKIFPAIAFFVLAFFLAGKTNAQLASDKSSSSTTVGTKATNVANKAFVETKLASEVSIKTTQTNNAKTDNGQNLSKPAKLTLASEQNLETVPKAKSLENKTVVDTQLPKQKQEALKNKAKVKN